MSPSPGYSLAADPRHLLRHSALQVAQLFLGRTESNHFGFCGPYGLSQLVSSAVVAQDYPYVINKWMNVAVSQ